MKGYEAVVTVEGKSIVLPIVSWKSPENVIVLYQERFHSLRVLDPNYKIRPVAVRPNNNNYQALKGRVPNNYQRRTQ